MGVIISQLIHKPKLSRSDKYFPAWVVQRLYETIDNPRDLAYIMYHVETGLRVSDVISSEWVHVDWHNHRTYTYDVKKKQWRWVYWPRKVKPKLQMWYKEVRNRGYSSRLIFPLSQQHLSRILKGWAQEVGFQHAAYVGSHWCRHTFIRLSRRAGRDIKAVQQNTGDSIKTILDWYSTPGPEEMREQIEVDITQ